MPRNCIRTWSCVDNISPVKAKVRCTSRRGWRQALDGTITTCVLASLRAHRMRVWASCVGMYVYTDWLTCSCHGPLLHGRGWAVDLMVPVSVRHADVGTNTLDHLPHTPQSLLGKLLLIHKHVHQCLPCMPLHATYMPRLKLCTAQHVPCFSAFAAACQASLALMYTIPNRKAHS